MCYSIIAFIILLIFSTVFQVNAARVSELGTLMVKKTTLGISKRANLVTTNCKKALSIGKRTTYHWMGNMPSGITGLLKEVGPGVLEVYRVKAQHPFPFMFVQQMIAPLNHIMIGNIWINTEIGVTLTRALQFFARIKKPLSIMPIKVQVLVACFT